MNQELILMTWLHNIYLRPGNNLITVRRVRSKFINALYDNGLVKFVNGFMDGNNYYARVTITPKGKIILLRNMNRLVPEEESWEKLIDPFQVLDALRGSISGEYQEDLQRLNGLGKTCTLDVYSEAYQMNEQP